MYIYICVCVCVCVCVCGFRLVLWHSNHCWLFDTKSVYSYIIIIIIMSRW